MFRYAIPDRVPLSRHCIEPLAHLITLHGTPGTVHNPPLTISSSIHPPLHPIHPSVHTQSSGLCLPKIGYSTARSKAIANGWARKKMTVPEWRGFGSAKRA